MKTRTIFQEEEKPLSDGLEDHRKSAYDAGLITGRETGYKLGFQDGFLASIKNRNEEVVNAEDETTPFDLAPNGKRLVGPPCSKCGHCYPGALTHCPRCKTPAPPPVRVESRVQSDSLTQSELVE